MKQILACILSCILAVPLAGCLTTAPPPPPPQVTVSGPVFPASTFDLSPRPSPPDPAEVGNKGGSAAAHYENRLGVWGGVCRVKLESVGRNLRAAGQVIDESKNAGAVR